MLTHKCIHSFIFWSWHNTREIYVIKVNTGNETGFLPQWGKGDLLSGRWHWQFVQFVLILKFLTRVQTIERGLLPTPLTLRLEAALLIYSAVQLAGAESDSRETEGVKGLCSRREGLRKTPRKEHVIYPWDLPEKLLQVEDEDKLKKTVKPRQVTPTLWILFK